MKGLIVKAKCDMETGPSPTRPADKCIVNDYHFYLRDLFERDATSRECLTISILKAAHFLPGGC